MRKGFGLLFLMATLAAAAADSAALAQQRINPNRLPPRQRRLDPGPLGNPRADRPGLTPEQVKRRQLRQQLMQAIGITADQNARMQEIRRSHEEEIIVAGRRVREARNRLDRAIMSEQYSEEQVRRATEDLAAAQADRVRLESRIRAEVRGVLTHEQIQRFHQLQREMRQRLREQKQLDKEMGLAAPAVDEDVDLVALLFSIF